MKNKENEKIMKESTCRTVVNIPIGIDNKFRELAVKRGISKSQMILFAMGWYIYYSNSMDSMLKMLKELKNVVESNKSKNF